MTWLAHSAGSAGAVQTLAEHLRETAALAGRFAEAFGATEEAQAAGLLHDLGKYGERFQARLKGEEHGIDHWTAGALLALERLKQQGVAVALSIHGHHLGLQQASPDALRGWFPQCWPQGRHPLGLRLSDEGGVSALVERFQADGFQVPTVTSTVYSGITGKAAAAMLDVRMLFSALVDADFLDTERHMTGRQREPGLPLAPQRAFEVLLSYLRDKAAAQTAAAEVQRLRADLLQACLDAATKAPGLFTLTAPTGAGKTLSMLAFALRHAAEHDLRRVVMVIPFLTIIEQTVSVYREVLRGLDGTDLDRYLLEDHSLAGARSDADLDDAGRSAIRLLAENWDAPLVVTTSVQLLESLFANRSRPCRKLHNLARSVILFDEVQTLPDRLATPTLATLSRLAERYGATVVFSTATQPAFTHLDPAVRRLCALGWQPREIAPPPLDLFRRIRRVNVRWPQRETERFTWAEIARQLAEHPQALCVVNLKRHAWALLDELCDPRSSLTPNQPVSIYHLSTSMCPAHRETVVKEVNRRLEADEPCILVSTQCVEAGVDVDFPVVFRAWGPLDALTQVAGRCNRNGRRQQGALHVFYPADDDRLYPTGAYQRAADVAASLFRELGPERMDLEDPELHQLYYRRLYDLQDLGNLDDSGNELVSFLRTQHFAEVAAHYRMIPRAAVNVLTPYKPEPFEVLAEEVRTVGLTRDWVTRARPFTVGIYRPHEGDPVSGHLEPVRVARTQEPAEDWFVYLTPQHYHPVKGLMPIANTDTLIA